MTETWGSFQSLLAPAMDDNADLFDAALLFLDDYDNDSAASHVASPSNSDSTHSSETDSLDGITAVPTPLWQQTQTMDAHLAIDKNALHVRLKFTQSDALAGGYQQPAPAAKLPPRRNKRREEINRLKMEAEQLQARLESMHLSSKTIVKQEVADRWLGQVVGSAWQSVAAGQRVRRLQSEEENRKLRGMINEQRRLGKALRRLVNRQAEAKEWSQFRPHPPPPYYESHTADEKMLDDPGMFEVLRTSLIAMQLQTDMVFSDPELAMLTTTYRTFRTEGHTPDSLAVHHLDSRIVPFTVNQTADALWEYYLRPGGKKMYTWEQIDPMTYQGQFVGYTTLGDYQGNTCAKMVVRRIEEPHRVVILRSSVFRCIDSARQHPFLRLPMRHFEWASIEKPRHPKLQASSEPLCQINVSDVSLPRLVDSDVSLADWPTEIARLVDVSLDISRFQADRSHDFVDNYLLSHTANALTSSETWAVDIAV